MLNKVEICGVNTSKLPLLTREEKEELLIKIKGIYNKSLTKRGEYNALIGIDLY